MVVVSVREDGIRVNGHARFAEAGKDIVCAGVSALTHTLLSSLEHLAGDKIQYSISPGRVDINYGNLSDAGRLLVDSFFVGVCLIADEYPQNVDVIRQGYFGRPGTEAVGAADKAGECRGSGRKGDQYGNL